MQEKICQQRRTLIKCAGTTALLSMLPPAFAKASEFMPGGPTNGALQRLYADKPATAGVSIEEAFPIGNGRIGAMIRGGIAQERFWFSDNSLWSGDSNPAGALDGGTFGSYEWLSCMTIDFTGIDEPAATGYQRLLDLQTAQSEVTFQANGATHTRQSFCSNPDQVIVLRITTDTAAALNGVISLSDSHDATISTDGTNLVAQGSLPNKQNYVTVIHVAHEGGTLAKSSSGLTFADVTTLTLFITGGTNYAADTKGWFSSSDPGILAKAGAKAAVSMDFATLVQRHRDDFGSMFNRVSLDLGRSTAQQRANSTIGRLDDNMFFVDPELITLYFQYARYLLISCSRKGGLPANMQGLWCIQNGKEIPFKSDYHADLDLEMNYWLAEPGNLTDCFSPLSDFIQSQLPAWRAATRANPLLKKTNGAASRGWRFGSIRISMGAWAAIGT